MTNLEKRKQQIAMSLKSLLAERNLSNQQASELIGISRSYLSLLLHSKLNLNMTTLCKIEDAFGCDLLQSWFSISIIEQKKIVDATTEELQAELTRRQQTTGSTNDKSN